MSRGSTPDSSRFADSQFDGDTSGGEHVDEGVDGEEIFFATDEVGDAGLGDAELLGGFTLGKALIGDVFP